MTKITKATVTTLHRPSGASITQSQLRTLTRQSGSSITNAQLIGLARQSGTHTTSASLIALRKTMQPSVRVAANYFETESVSMREVFQKTGKQSLRELVRLTENEIPY